MPSKEIYFEEITQLIAHREPVLMVDSLKIRKDAFQGTTFYRISPKCVFLNSFSELTPEGLLEHIAQSSAAMIGSYNTKVIIGLIGEIIECSFYSSSLKVGDSIMTEIKLLFEYNNVFLVSATSHFNKQMIIVCKMKLSLNTMTD